MQKRICCRVTYRNRLCKSQGSRTPDGMAQAISRPMPLTPLLILAIMAR